MHAGGKHTKLCGSFDSQSVKDWTVLAMYKKDGGDDDDDDDEHEEGVGDDNDKKNKTKNKSGCECYDCIKNAFEIVVNAVADFLGGKYELLFTGDIKMLQCICGLKYKTITIHASIIVF